MNFYFPWLKFDTEPDRRKMRLYSNPETLDELRPDIFSVIVELNMCDMALYDKMKNMHSSERILVNSGVFDVN